MMFTTEHVACVSTSTMHTHIIIISLGSRPSPYVRRKGKAWNRGNIIVVMLVTDIPAV